MKQFLVFILAFLSALGASSQVVPIRGDTVRVYKQGGNATIRIENATRTLQGGVATNIDGKGTLGFVATQLSGDTLFIGGDTVIITGIGGSVTLPPLYLLNGLHARDTITAVWGTVPGDILDTPTTINGGKLFDVTFDSTTLMMHETRFELAQGTAVAAANDLFLGTGGNLFSITGITQINAIATTGWQAGSVISFIFADTPLVKHNTAGGAGTAVMLLAGNIDYLAAAGDYIAFQFDGVSWHETSRRLASGSALYGIDAVLSVNQHLSTNRLIQTDAFSLSIQGTSSVLGLISSGGNALTILGTANSAAAVSIVAAGSGNIGAVISSSASWAAQLAGDRSSTNSIVTLLDIQRTTSNTAGNGIGTAIEFTLENDAGTVSTAHLIESIMTDVTNGAETTKMVIIGKFAGSAQNDLVLYGNGVWNAPGVANWGNFANNAAAITGGLVTGDLYRNGDVVQIVH